MNNLQFGYLTFGICTALLLLCTFLKTSRRVRITSLIIWTLSSVLTISNHIVWRLTGTGFNESIPYHLRFGMEGAGVSDFYQLIVIVIIALVVLGLVLYVFIQYFLNEKTSSAWLAWLLLLQLAALAAHPLPREIFSTYHIQENSSVSFENHFVTPSLENSKTGYNIVWIYAESMERTYFDSTLFPDLVPHLKKLEAQSLSFTNVQQVYGTGWTIAGIVSSQCGMPLVTMGMNGNELARMKYFLPGAVGVGDILDAKKYNQVFMQGSGVWFAGTGKYLNTHKFHVLSIDEFKDSIDEAKDVTGWGITDDKLFDFARKRYQGLNGAGKPFALMLSTINTHHPDGHVPVRCLGMRYRDGANPILNAVHCSDSLIAAFVMDIRKMDIQHNTLVVISSDHLAMTNTAYDLLEQGKRRNLLLFNLPGKISPGKIDKPASMMDAGVTALDLSDLDIGHIGLGRSLVRNEKTLVEEFPEEYDPILRGWEGKFNKCWIPKNR